MKFIPDWITREFKSSRAGQVIVSSLKWPGPVGHVNFEALSKESYERNVTVNLCVSLIATNGAGVPWFLMKRGKTRGSKAQRIMTPGMAYKAEMFRGVRRAAVLKALTMTEVETHPALTLLENPNPFESQAEYLLRNIGFFLLSGNSYEELVSPNRPDAPPLELYNLRPDRVEIIPNSGTNRAKYPDVAKVIDATAPILGFKYTIADKNDVFDARTVLHRKFFHPTDDFYGLSPLQAAARHYRTDNLSADWNYALLKNQARPAGALVANASLDDSVHERLKQELRDSYSGSNAGMPMLLEGDMKWQPFGLTPLEMDWLAGTRDSRGQVCAVYHVPPEMTGDPEHRTYNSMPEAHRALWMNAILPVLDAIRDSYNNRLIPRFGDGLFLDYDRDQIDALSEDQAKVWDRVQKTTVLSLNEKRAAIGYDDYEGDPEEDPAADVPQDLLAKPNPFDALSSGATSFGRQPAEPDPGSKTAEIERKAQAFTSVQKRARKRLKSAIASHYRKQGEELSAFLKREIGKLS